MSFLTKDEDGDWTFSVGKYEGETLESIAEADPKYVSWAYNNTKISPAEAEAIEEVCEEHNIEL